MPLVAKKVTPRRNGSSNARGRSHGLITCSANVNVSIGANPYGVQEHAWRACEHAYQAYLGYV